MSQVSEEVAKAELERFCEAMDLDLDTSRLNEEAINNLEDAKHQFVRAVMNGSLVVEDDGVPVFTPRKMKDAQPIRFPEPTGAVKMEIDRISGRYKAVTKTYALMEALTGQSKGFFSKMLNRDLKVCEAITNLFLG